MLNRAAPATRRVHTPPAAVTREALAGGESNAVGHRIALAPRKRLSRCLRGRIPAPVNAVRAMHGPGRPRTRERAGVRWYAAPTAGAVGGVFVGSGFVQGLHGLFLVWGCLGFVGSSDGKFRGTLRKVCERGGVCGGKTGLTLGIQNGWRDFRFREKVSERQKTGKRFQAENQGFRGIQGWKGALS